jgi:hypothetical protein
MLDVDSITSGCDCRDPIARVLVGNDTTCACVSWETDDVLPKEAYSMHPDP